MSLLLGFGVVLFFLPFNSFVWHFMEKYNTQQMQFKDERVNLITEILNGIKVLKLYAWEKSFIEKIGEIRHEEINFMKRAQYLEATQFLMWNSAPFLIALSSFTCYVLVDPVNNILDPQTAFVSLTLFNTLKEPLFLLPFGISNMIRGKVSIDRIKDFLNADETDPTSVTHDTMEDAITVGHASFTWNLNDQKDTLRDLSFNVKQGSLVAVVGHVGAGKSSLVSSILGELKKTNGVLNVNGEVAYVSQQAWMRNMTLKENILFSKRYNKVLYDKTIENCALVSDLEMLPAGDTTEIGEKGINLSGGQKQRINLARAVYSKKDIYLFDDPLSAVDAHVGKHIFEKVIGPKGMLQRKTRILVTHGISFLPDTDYILVMKNGRIAEQGSYSQLIKQQGEFSAFILEQLKTAEDSETETDNEAIWKDLEASQGKEFVSKKKIEKAAHRRPKTKSVGSISVLSESDENNPPPSYYSKQTSVADRSSSETVYKTLAGKRGLIEEEHVEVKGVKLEIYIYYMKSGGFLLGIAAFFAYFFFESFQVGNNIWLSVWSDDERAAYDFDVRNMYLIVYGCLGLMQSVFIYTAIMLVTFAAVNASKCLHYDLLKSILKSPMSFFDTTPVGRIVNRFSKDMDEVDVMVPLHFKDCFSQLVIALGAVFVICYSTPITIIAVIPLTAIFLLYTSFYLRTSRQLKRIISINRSPINSHIEETLSGAATIRAYGLEDKFEDENEAKIEDLQKAQYPETISNSWLFLRLQMVGNILIFLTSLITVINRKSVDAGTVGLSLSYVLTCNIDIYMLVRMFADLDKTIVSVERIKEYQEIPQESASKTDRDPSANWPMFGSITFDSYSTRYRPGLDLVLTNINCKIESGEKVGIVGRTGAGKSSITLALFRIIEKVSGRILIDNVDVSEIGLTRLRSALTIIPQDPVIFSGTLRSNLDPFNLYTDRLIFLYCYGTDLIILNNDVNKN